MKYPIIILCLAYTACHGVKQKARETVNKTGEVIAKTGSEFVAGVSKGVEKTFQNEVVFSEQLKKQGLESGKIIINSTDSSKNNILTAYLIFNDYIDQSITVKLINESEQEYGRVTQNIKGKKGEAKYFDFTFDKRTNIDGKGKILFE